MTSNTTIAGRTLADAAPHTRTELDRIYAKISSRLIPVIFIAYLFAFLDRINIGYAKLQMQQALGFSDAVYGLGAGVFFVSYLLLEVPSNLLFERMGARLTFFRIMVLWGMTSAATMFVQTPTQFYILRLLLGAFEAGFFPGIILYLTYWFPSSRRGRVTGQFLFAMPIAGAIGGPLSGWLMTRMHGLAGLDGWQWCLLVEGLPSILIGFICYRMLTNRPQDAKWLTQAEKNAVVADLASDKTQDSSHERLRDAFTDPKVYLIALIYFCNACGAYTFSFWLPTMIKTLGITDLAHVGLYSMFSYIFGALGMLLLPWNSDRMRDRRWHFVIAMIVGAIALSASATGGMSFLLALSLLCVSMFAVFGAGAVFWTIPPTYLSGKAVAPGIAFISALGISGGLASPVLIGAVKTYSGSMNSGLYAMSGVLIAGALLAGFSLKNIVRRS